MQRESFEIELFSNSGFIYNSHVLSFLFQKKKKSHSIKKNKEEHLWWNRRHIRNCAVSTLIRRLNPRHRILFSAFLGLSSRPTITMHSFKNRMRRRTEGNKKRLVHQLHRIFFPRFVSSPPTLVSQHQQQSRQSLRDVPVAITDHDLVLRATSKFFFQ